MWSCGPAALKIAVPGLEAGGIHLHVEQPVRRAVVPHRAAAIAWVTAMIAVAGFSILVR
jgi:hypothetical protein